jgi:hypothetical protein
MNPVYIIIFACLLAIIVYVFLKQVEKAKNEAVREFKAAETRSENVVIPEEYNNVSLGVWQGVKFGFGFGIGSFVAGLLITIFIVTIWGASLLTVLLSLVKIN